MQCVNNFVRTIASTSHAFTVSFNGPLCLVIGEFLKANSTWIVESSRTIHGYFVRHLCIWHAAQADLAWIITHSQTSLYTKNETKENTQKERSPQLGTFRAEQKNMTSKKYDNHPYNPNIGSTAPPPPRVCIIFIQYAIINVFDFRWYDIGPFCNEARVERSKQPTIRLQKPHPCWVAI